MQITPVVVLATLTAGIAALPTPEPQIGAGQLRRIERAEFRKGERMGERREARRMGIRSIDDDSELATRSPQRNSFIRHEERKMFLAGERAGERKEGRRLGVRSVDDDAELDTRSPQRGSFLRQEERKMFRAG
ncbi:hypothetical protein DACRYDRAFT_24128, partial [Dacryopinax primogenitus]